MFHCIAKWLYLFPFRYIEKNQITEQKKDANTNNRALLRCAQKKENKIERRKNSTCDRMKESKEKKR